jgi:hypothetical protein
MHKTSVHTPLGVIPLEHRTNIICFKIHTKNLNTLFLVSTGGRYSTNYALES